MTAPPRAGSVRLDRSDTPARLVLTGEIDAGVDEDARHVVRELERATPPVVVDATAVTFMDCYGLRVILAAAERFPTATTIVGAPPVVVFLVEEAGLGGLLAGDLPGDTAAEPPLAAPAQP